jgi:hypothetical protein
MLSSDKQKTFRLADIPVGCGDVSTPLSILPEMERERIIKGKISELNHAMLAEIDRLERMQECAEAYIETLHDTIKDLENRLRSRDATATYFYTVLRLVLPRHKTRATDKAEHVALILKAKNEICGKHSPDTLNLKTPKSEKEEAK